MQSLHDARGVYRAARNRYGRAYNKWFKNANIRPLTKEQMEINSALAAKADKLGKIYLEKEKLLAVRLGMDPYSRNVFPEYGRWHSILMGYKDPKVNYLVTTLVETVGDLREDFDYESSQEDYEDLEDL